MEEDVKGNTKLEEDVGELLLLVANELEEVLENCEYELVEVGAVVEVVVIWPGPVDDGTN